MARRRASRDADLARRRRAQKLILDDMHAASGMPAHLRIADPEIEPMPDFLPTPEEIAAGEFDLADLIDGAEQLMAKSIADAEAELARAQPMIELQKRFAAEPRLSTIDAILAQIEVESGTAAPRLTGVQAELADARNLANAGGNETAKDALDQLIGQLGGPLITAKDDETALAEACARFKCDDSSGATGEIGNALDAIPKQLVDGEMRAQMPTPEPREPEAFPGLLESLAIPDQADENQTAAIANARAKLADLDKQIAGSFPALKAPEGGSVLICSLRRFGRPARRKNLPGRLRMPSRALPGWLTKREASSRRAPARLRRHWH